MSEYAKIQNASATQFLQLSRKVIKAAATKVMFWTEVVRQRRQLQSLTDEMLDDIGIDGTHARFEWEKPFWDIDVPRSRSSGTSASKCSTTNHFTSFHGNFLTGGRA